MVLGLAPRRRWSWSGRFDCGLPTGWWQKPRIHILPRTAWRIPSAGCLQSRWWRQDQVDRIGVLPARNEAHAVGDEAQEPSRPAKRAAHGLDRESSIVCLRRHMHRSGRPGLLHRGHSTADRYTVDRDESLRIAGHNLGRPAAHGESCQGPEQQGGREQSAHLRTRFQPSTSDRGTGTCYWTLQSAGHSLSRRPPGRH